MSRTTRLLAALAVLATPVVAAAQSSDAIIQKEGASPLATAITFPLARDLTYRVAWGVNVGPEAADGVVEGFRRPANFLFLSDRNGLARSNVKLAVVVYGTATQSLLRNEAYKAAKGTDNGSIPLLEALDAAGVQVIVCGEALVKRKIANADLLPFVKVAPTAMMALATLHAQGYQTFQP